MGAIHDVQTALRSVSKETASRGRHDYALISTEFQGISGRFSFDTHHMSIPVRSQSFSYSMDSAPIPAPFVAPLYPVLGIVGLASEDAVPSVAPSTAAPSTTTPAANTATTPAAKRSRANIADVRRTLAKLFTQRNRALDEAPLVPLSSARNPTGPRTPFRHLLLPSKVRIFPLS